MARVARVLTHDRVRRHSSKGMAVLLTLIASSALSIVVSAMVQSGDKADNMRDINWTFRLQAHIRERVMLEAPEDTPTEEDNPLEEEAAAPLLLDEYTALQCQNVSHSYDSLLDHNLRFWSKTGLVGLENHNSTSAQMFYIVNNTMYMKRGADRGGLLPSYFGLLKSLMSKMVFPDMALPFNSGDNPNQPLDQSDWGGTGVPLPVCSFCTTPRHTDILFPNVLEGDVVKRNEAPKYATHRLHRAVWRGTTDAFQGWRKGRNALLQLGLEHPELIDSGVSRWSDELMNQTLPDKRFLKESLSFEEQVAMYRYHIWAPGNCASVRLALQLASDAAVFKIEIDETEWYYPLLKPFVHYIPLEANSTHVNLEEMMYWARHHQSEVQAIVSEANEFARLYLSPTGRDCYTLQLIQRLHSLTLVDVTLPETAINITHCDPLDHCPEPPLYEVEPGDEALLDDLDQAD